MVLIDKQHISMFFRLPAHSHETCEGNSLDFNQKHHKRAMASGINLQKAELSHYRSSLFILDKLVES